MKLFFFLPRLILKGFPISSSTQAEIGRCFSYSYNEEKLNKLKTNESSWSYGIRLQGKPPPWNLEREVPLEITQMRDTNESFLLGLGDTGTIK